MQKSRAEDRLTEDKNNITEHQKSSSEDEVPYQSVVRPTHFLQGCIPLVSNIYECLQFIVL